MEAEVKLSNDQTAAVMHGLKRSAPTWEPVELPTGRIELPDWLLDVHVDMCRGSANSPRVQYKVKRKPWPVGEEELFELEDGDCWRARSSDGWTMVQHVHSGAPKKTIAWRVGNMSNPYCKDGYTEWQTSDDSESKVIAEANKHLKFCRERGSPDACLETKECWTTPKQDGYGGRIFWIKTKDGREIALRGPWYGGCPLGWDEATCYERKDQDPWEIRQDRDGVPWYKRGGYFGYYVSEELKLRAIAVYAPHLRMARVFPGYGPARLEPYESEWGGPKRWIKQEDRQPGEGIQP